MVSGESTRPDCLVMWFVQNCEVQVEFLVAEMVAPDLISEESVDGMLRQGCKLCYLIGFRISKTNGA